MMLFIVKINVAMRKQKCQKIGSERATNVNQINLVTFNSKKVKVRVTQKGCS